MKKMVLILSAWVLWAGEPMRLGRLTADKALFWDASEGATSYNVYLAETNTTNFAKVATVTEAKWRGDATKDWNGEKLVYVTAENSKGESDPSDIVIVPFAAGVPLPPSRIQIYAVITAAATNALPVVK